MRTRLTFIGRVFHPDHTRRNVYATSYGSTILGPTYQPPFKVGDRVEFNGSGDGRFPRIYKGIVRAVNEDTLDIEDDAWHAISEVAFPRIRHLKED